MNIRNGSENIPTTIPDRGARPNHPRRLLDQCEQSHRRYHHRNKQRFYTASGGYGPGSNGEIIRPTRASVFRHPSALIVFADGAYADMQGQNRIGVKDRRIGFSHPGGVGSANTTFANGQVSRIRGDIFPRGGFREDNVGSASTLCYAETSFCA